MKYLKFISRSVLCVFNIVLATATMYASPFKQQRSMPSLSFNASIKKESPSYKPIKCLMLCLNPSDHVKRVAKVIKFDLTFTDQVDVDVRQEKISLHDKDVKGLFDRETSLYLSLEQKKKSIKVVLKDTFSGATVFEKNYKGEGHPVVLGHIVSNDLIPLLTGQPSVTMSTLAYCKQLSPFQKVICISDYAGMIELPIINTKSLNVAPSWHSHMPYLFYSRFMPTRSSLMSYNIRSAKHSPVCSYDGLNMQPSFSKDGRQVALCLSAQGKNSEIFLYDQKLCNQVGHRTFRQLTSNGGSNASPCLLPSGDVVFCSDFEIKVPQLYYLNRKNNEVKRLSDGRSYCAAPAFNEKFNSIVYTRYIKGVFQLFTMNLNAGRASEKQLTFGKRDKLDPAWSACGRYVFFTLDHINKKSGKRIPQVASFNCLSKKVRVLTKGGFPKSFPAWTDQSYYQIRLT